MYKCFCGKLLKDRKALSGHLSRMEKLNGLDKEKLVVETIYGKEKVEAAIKKYLNKDCSIYGLEEEGLYLDKYFALLGIKRTSKEERATKRYQDKFKKSVFEKYGVDNISKSEEYKKKKSETVMKNFGVTHNLRMPDTIKKAKDGIKKVFDSPDLKAKMQDKYKKTCKEKYGVDNVAKIKEVRKVNSEKQKLKISRMSLEERRAMTEKARDYWNSQNSWESSIEIKVKDILKDLNIEYQEHITLYGYNYDIVIEDIIIEVNGDFWHGNPLKYRPGDKLFSTLLVDDIWEKDARKTRVAQENKKRVYILWESDIIRSSDEQLIRTLKEWIL